jgi:hypothetical protein
MRLEAAVEGGFRSSVEGTKVELSKFCNWRCKLFHVRRNLGPLPLSVFVFLASDCPHKNRNMEPARKHFFLAISVLELPVTFFLRLWSPSWLEFSAKDLTPQAWPPFVRVLLVDL